MLVNIEVTKDLTTKNANKVIIRNIPKNKYLEYFLKALFFIIINN